MLRKTLSAAAALAAATVIFVADDDFGDPACHYCICIFSICPKGASDAADT
jgi:hypothetical protein